MLQADLESNLVVEEAAGEVQRTHQDSEKARHMFGHGLKLPLPKAGSELHLVGEESFPGA